MRFFIRTIFLLLLLVFSASAGNPVIVLGAEDAAGPWGQADGRGCGNDIVVAAYKAVGIDVELKILPYARAKKMTIDGTLSGCFAMSVDSSIAGNVVLSDRPLYTVRAMLFKKSNGTILLTKDSDIVAGMTIGSVLNYEYPSALQALSRRGVLFEPVATEEMNLKKLAAGRIQSAVVMVDELKSVPFMLTTCGVEGLIDSAFAVGSQGSYVGFSLKNSSGLFAKRKFDEGFAIIRANGVYRDIIQKWGHRHHP